LTSVNGNLGNSIRGFSPKAELVVYYRLPSAEADGNSLELKVRIEATR